LEIDSPTVISDEVDGETLALNLATGAYYVIPRASGPVWRALACGVPAADILAGTDDPRSPALAAYVQALLAAGLLRPAASAAATGPLQWAADDLQVEAHTDMADLLGLDPIHDADENVGWPMHSHG
jgi:hypothetical protein